MPFLIVLHLYIIERDLIMPKLKLQALHEQITERLCARILRGGLEPGDVLGAERKLAEEFGVSYDTIRESVQRLRALGIISSKQRVGLVVNKAEPVQLFSQLMPFMAYSQDDFDQLLEFRIAIEIGAVALTVERVREDILLQMESTIEPFEQLQKEGRILEADVYDLEFHSLLLKASSNELLSGLHSVISKYFQKSSNVFPVLTKHANPERTGDHRNLLKAIKQKKTFEAIEILQQHLRGWKLHIIDRSDNE